MGLDCGDVPIVDRVLETFEAWLAVFLTLIMDMDR